MVLDGGRELRPRHQPSAATGNLLFRGCQRSPDQAWPSVFEIDPSCVPALSTSLVVSATRTSQSPQNGPPTDQSIELPGRTGHRWRDRTSSQLACRVRGVPTKDVSGRAYTPADTGGAGPVGGLLSLLARSPPRSSSRARILTGRAYSEISCWRTRPDCGVRLRFHRPSRGSGIPWSVRRGSFGAQAGPLRLGEAHLLPGLGNRSTRLDSRSGIRRSRAAIGGRSLRGSGRDPPTSPTPHHRHLAPTASRPRPAPNGGSDDPMASAAAQALATRRHSACVEVTVVVLSSPAALRAVPWDSTPRTTHSLSPFPRRSAGAYLAGRLSTSRGVQEPSRPAAIKPATVASDALRLALIDQVDQQAWMSRADVPLLGRPQAPAGQGMSGGWLPTWHPTIRPMTPPAGKSGARPHSVGVHGF